MSKSNTLYIATLLVFILVLVAPVRAKQEEFDVSAFKHPMILVIDDPRSVRAKFGARGSHYDFVLDYKDDPVLNKISQDIIDDYKLTAGLQWPIVSISKHCIIIEKPTSEILDKLQNDSRVAWIQPYNTFSTQREITPSPNSPFVYTPSKPLANKGRGVNIVVIDTGIAVQHPALSEAKLFYRDFVSDDRPANKETHGTAVTGLLSASSGLEEFPVQGLLADAYINHFRGCWQLADGNGRCSTLSLALALDAAVKLKPDLINLSLSGPPDRVLEEIIKELVDDGSIVVSAHDPSRRPTSRFPMPQQGVIFAYGNNTSSFEKSLMKTLPTNTFLASYSAVSLTPDGRFDVYKGHSIAAPQITAVIASLLAEDPNIKNTSIAKRLKEWFYLPNT